MLEELFDKKTDIQKTAEYAIADKNIIPELVNGLTEKNEDYRYNCSKVLHAIARTHAETIYPYWDNLVALMTSKNSFHKMSAVNLLAVLTEVDTENKFVKIFDKYYSLLDDPSVFVAIYVAQNSGKIAKAKPELEVKITNKLLDIDKTHHLPGRKDLIIAGIIASFDEYFTHYPGKSAMLDFVRPQVNNHSPKTKKAAKAFIKKWDK